MIEISKETLAGLEITLYAEANRYTGPSQTACNGLQQGGELEYIYVKIGTISFILDDFIDEDGLKTLDHDQIRETIIKDLEKN
jgi:hypothetical protein